MGFKSLFLEQEVKAKEDGCVSGSDVSMLAFNLYLCSLKSPVCACVCATVRLDHDGCVLGSEELTVT